MEFPNHDLPLFPLNTVLFPRTPLPLHIFEPRYLEMIERCVEQQIGFGVLLITEGEEVGGPAETHQVGTIVRVANVDRQADGRLMILGMGAVRFRLVERLDLHPYPSGNIEVWRDELGDLKKLAGLAAEAQKAYAAYISELVTLLDPSRRVPSGSTPADPQVLSCTIAANLQVPNEDKQTLLEAETVADRLEQELALLERERAYLGRVRNMRFSFVQGPHESFSKN